MPLPGLLVQFPWNFINQFGNPDSSEPKQHFSLSFWHLLHVLQNCCGGRNDNAPNHEDNTEIYMKYIDFMAGIFCQGELNKFGRSHFFYMNRKYDISVVSSWVPSIFFHSYLAELLFLMEKLCSLLRKHQTPLQRYFVQYLSRFDALVLSDVIQVWNLQRRRNMVWWCMVSKSSQSNGHHTRMPIGSKGLNVSMLYYTCLQA